MKSYFNKNHPLLNVLISYKKNFPIDNVHFKEVSNYLKNKNYLITGKIDGELNLIYYSRKNKKCELLSKNGRVRTELPLTYEIETILAGKNINEFIGIGELYVEEEPNKIMSYPKAISILRKPKSEDDLQKIKLMIFDIINIDGRNYLERPIFERIKLIKKLFNGNYVKPVIIFDTTDFDKAWRKVIQKKELFEGLVIVFEDGTRIKVKPIITIDLAVVGVEISKSDPTKMGALQLAYLNEEGLFIFDSKVGTGFTDQERIEWLEWAEEHEVERKDNMIYIDPYEDPKIVEVEVREIHIEEGPGMKFDKKNKKWIHIDDYPVGTLRQPSFKRIRDDKRLVPEDLRLSQVLDFNFEKSTSLYSVIADRYTYIVSPIKNHILKLSTLFDAPYFVNNDMYILQIDTDNDEYKGLKPGDKVISLTKGIKGIIIDYEQIWCPKCNIQTIPLPRYNFPMFSVFYVCPQCNHYLERTDVDYLIKWDEPIDEGYLYVSEAHPTEIKKISYLKPGTENDIVIKSDYYTLTKKHIYDYYNSVKNKFPFNIKVFIIIMTDTGPILRRNLKKGEPIILTEELFDKLNTGRTVEFHKVISGEKIDYFFVDIDPKEQVPFNKTKKLTKELYEYLNEWNEVIDLGLQFSGNRGFYILGKLKKTYNIDDLRYTLISLLEDFISYYKYNDVSTGIVYKPNMIRLDVSTLKKNGSIKIPYSLSYKTGLISLPLNIEDITSFEKEDAKITVFLKRSFKNIDFMKLKNIEGRFVIQDHYTFKRKQNHFDFRLEIPIEITK